MRGGVQISATDQVHHQQWLHAQQPHDPFSMDASMELVVASCHKMIQASQRMP